MATQQVVSVQLGIPDSSRQHLVEHLEKLLADTFLLALKSQYFHWNVTGPMFQPLHAVFEEQYKALYLAADELAERIRSLGHPTPGTCQQFIQLANITENITLPNAMTMIQRLLEDHETVIRTMRPVVEIASENGDISTADLLTKRLDEHEKTAWMLRSFLG